MVTRDCLKGWIVAPSPTDGQPVPFFIKVREKDIVYDEYNLPEKIKNLTTGITKQITFHNSFYTFELNEWSIKLYENGNFEAVKRINVNDSFSSTDSISLISATENLPFKVKSDNYFTVSLEKECKNTDILGSFISYECKSSDMSSDNYESINIYLYNPLTNFVSDSVYKSDRRYNECFIITKVNGNIY